MSTQPSLGEPSMSVSKAVFVRRDPEEAFRLFVDGINSWWPLATGRYTYGGDRAGSIFLEAQAGGRFYERFSDGEEHLIGRVSVCERPDRIVFEWRTPEVSTEVEVRFGAAAGGARVELDHRGVERMAGGAGWSAGWDEVLGYYTRAAEA